MYSAAEETSSEIKLKIAATYGIEVKRKENFKIKMQIIF